MSFPSRPPTCANVRGRLFCRTFESGYILATLGMKRCYASAKKKPRKSLRGLALRQRRARDSNSQPLAGHHISSVATRLSINVFSALRRTWLYVCAIAKFHQRPLCPPTSVPLATNWLHGNGTSAIELLATPSSRRPSTKAPGSNVAGLVGAYQSPPTVRAAITLATWLALCQAVGVGSWRFWSETEVGGQPPRRTQAHADRHAQTRGIGGPQFRFSHEPRYRCAPWARRDQHVSEFSKIKFNIAF